MKKLFIVIVLGLTLVGISLARSEAGVKTIYPDQLTPANNDFFYYQTPDFIKSNTANDLAEFYARVKLPVGKTITKVALYHLGTTNTAVTKVYFYRSKLDEQRELIAYVSASDDSGDILKFEDTTINSPKIKGGYTYYVRAISANFYSYIRGVKIFYK